MFDISLGEMAVIGAVALVVLGPEKLPKVARTAGLLFGRAQRMAASFRADLEREMQNAEIDELRKSMTETAAQLQDEMANSAASVSEALAEPENRIQPPAAEEVTPAAKPKRVRKPPMPPAEPPVPVAEADTLPPKKPRKRKAAEPQADLFAAPAPVPPQDAGDRR